MTDGSPWQPRGTFTSRVFHVTTKSEGRLVLNSAFKKPASGKVCKEPLCRAPSCGCGCGFLLCSLQELTPHPEGAETREITAPSKVALMEPWANPGQSVRFRKTELHFGWCLWARQNTGDDGTRAPSPSSGAHARSHCLGAAPPSPSPVTVLILTATPGFRCPATLVGAGAPAPAFFPRRQMTSTRAPGALRHPCPKAGSVIPSPRLEDPPGRGPCRTQSHGARWPTQPARPRLPFSLGLSRTASRGRVLLGLLSRVLCPQAQPQPPCWLSRERGQGPPAVTCDCGPHLLPELLCGPQGSMLPPGPGRPLLGVPVGLGGGWGPLSRRRPCMSVCLLRLCGLSE